MLELCGAPSTSAPEPVVPDPWAPHHEALTRQLSTKYKPRNIGSRQSQMCPSLTRQFSDLCSAPASSLGGATWMISEFPSALSFQVFHSNVSLPFKVRNSLFLCYPSSYVPLIAGISSLFPNGLTWEKTLGVFAKFCWMIALKSIPLHPFVSASSIHAILICA